VIPRRDKAVSDWTTACRSGGRIAAGDQARQGAGRTVRKTADADEVWLLLAQLGCSDGLAVRRPCMTPRCN